MFARRLIHEAFGAIGLRVVRLAAHRGVSLEADLARLLNLRSELTFVDAGANVGDITQRFARAFPQARVFAFEPVLSTFTQLERSTRRLPLVHCIQAALGERHGTASMRVEAKSVWNRIVSSAEKDQDGLITVQMTTLDKFCLQNSVPHISLLKTDCEGYDIKVIEGAHDLLAERRIDAVYSEVNFTRDGRQGDFFALHDLLSRHGYVFYALYDYSGVGSPLRQSFANALWLKTD